MNVAQKLVECLAAEGVEVIFGIPGEENLEIIEALAASPIRFITTRHEQGAAFMADVYGRLTGKAGVCLATLGPGATNLITGVADANSDGAPLVAITGQVSTERMHITGHQYLDLNKLFEPITKRTKLVMRPDSITEIVRLAFKYAQRDGKMGATFIDLPVDVARMDVPENMKPIDSYVQHNPNHLSDADLAILMGWKNAIADSFIVLRHLKSGSIFIPTSATDAAYIVSGIYSPWDEMLRGAPLPQVIDAVLIPFENKIICDSVIAPYRVRLVGQMRSSMNDHYRVLKASGRVFKTFPDKG